MQNTQNRNINYSNFNNQTSVTYFNQHEKQKQMAPLNRINTKLISNIKSSSLPKTERTNRYSNGIQINVKTVGNPERIKSILNDDNEERRVAHFKNALKRAKQRLENKELLSNNQIYCNDRSQKQYSKSAIKQSTIIKQLNIDQSSYSNIGTPIHSIFYQQLYTSLNSANKKIFKKQCLRLGQKRITGDAWIMNLTYKPKANKLLMNADLLNPDLKQRSLQLISPRSNEILEMQSNCQYLFNFSIQTYPIVFKIDDQLVLAPICMIGMLKPEIKFDQSYLGNQSRVMYQSQIALSNVVIRVQEKFTLNDQIFVDIQEVAEILCLEKFKQEETIVYEGSYYFYDSKISIKIRQRTSSDKSQIENEKFIDGDNTNSYINSSQMASNLSKFKNDRKYFLNIYLKKSENMDKVQALMKQLIICLQKYPKIKKVGRSNQFLVNYT